MGRIVRASIVIVTYRHRDVIGRCLEAAISTTRPDDEIVVVDNASGDGTADVIAAYAPRVRLVRSEANLGYAGGCNAAARLVSGDAMVFLNPDTEARAGWLDALVDALDIPGAGLVGPKLLQAQRAWTIDANGVNVHLSGIPTSRAWGRPATSHTAVEEVAAVSGACFAVRPALFDRLGGFDEHAWYMEDVDLSLRVRAAGLRCLVTPSAEVLHVHPPGVWPAKLFYIERSRYWLLLRTFRARTLLGLVPALVLGEVVAWGFAVRAGPAHVAAKARAWIGLARWLRELPRVRARYDAERRVSDRALLRLHGTRLPFAQAAGGPFARAAELVVAMLVGAVRPLAELAADARER